MSRLVARFSEIARDQIPCAASKSRGSHGGTPLVSEPYSCSAVKWLVERRVMSIRRPSCKERVPRVEGCATGLLPAAPSACGPLSDPKTMLAMSESGGAGTL